jgi:hypothetical protein
MTVSGGPSRPTILVADAVAVAADEYHAVKCNVDGFRMAFVRVVCDQIHDVFIQGIAYEGGDAADLVIHGTLHYAETSIPVDTGGGRGYIVPVDALYQLQVVVHNTSGTTAAAATVEVTLC